MTINTNTPETFGDATVTDETDYVFFNLPVDAPAVPETGHKPAVSRLLQGDGTNIITFSFGPGQYLTDHKAAHPITVQCVAGVLDFTIGKDTFRLAPGAIVHLKERIIHRVDCPTDAPARNVLLLHMLTGERH